MDNKQNKPEEIIRAIVRLCDDPNRQGKSIVSFSPDWGGHSLTIDIEGRGHSHAGIPSERTEESFQVLVDDLHAMLCREGGHLEFVNLNEKETNG